MKWKSAHLLGATFGLTFIVEFKLSDAKWLVQVFSINRVNFSSTDVIVRNVLLTYG